MRIKDLIKGNPGFQHVVDNMECMSAAGRRVMLDAPFLSDANALLAEWQRLAAAISSTTDGDKRHAYNDLRHCFMQLHDLQGTLTSLSAHTPLNEVELFELKLLAHLTTKARIALNTLGLSAVLPLPDLTEVFSLLDPDHTGVVNFYIYDTYDSRLAPLRAELRALQEHNGDAARIGDLLAAQAEIQQAVCLRLCDALYAHCQSLSTAMEQMAYGDFLFAKAELCQRWKLVQPQVGNRVRYEGLFNPRLRDHNEALGLRYQAIDVEVASGVTLITGANMAGKTVLLKSLGTAQTMVQCGLYAPASKAEVMLFEGVATSIGDAQNEMNGLSSYASEIITISDITHHQPHRRQGTGTSHRNALGAKVFSQRHHHTLRSTGHRLPPPPRARLRRRNGRRGSHSAEYWPFYRLFAPARPHRRSASRGSSHSRYIGLQPRAAIYC